MVRADDSLGLMSGNGTVREFKEPDHETLARVMEAAQAAQDAAYGDSNDEEIDLLRGALEEALGALGLRLPEGREPEEEE